MDKISYALGLGIGQQIKSMNIENFSIEDFAKSISDVMEDKETAFTSREAQVMLQEFFQKKQKEEAEKFIAEGKAYLDENAKKEGVTVTKSGLQYEVLQEGTGKSPKATDTVRCHYEGRLLDGTVFDAGTLDAVPVGAGRVIPGFDAALAAMSAGAEWEVTIPAELAYGEQAMDKIPAMSTLVFKLKVVEVVNQSK